MRVLHHTNGPRLYVLGLRVHHGLTGLVLTCLGLARHERGLTVLGLALALEDAHDFPWRLRDPA